MLLSSLLLCLYISVFFAFSVPDITDVSLNAAVITFINVFFVNFSCKALICVSASAFVFFPSLSLHPSFWQQLKVSCVLLLRLLFITYCWRVHWENQCGIKPSQWYGQREPHVFLTVLHGHTHTHSAWHSPDHREEELWFRTSVVSECCHRVSSGVLPWGEPL